MSREAGVALPRAVRWYAHHRAARARLRRFSEAVTDGVFLGLMDREALEALDRSFYATATEPVGEQIHRYDEAAHIQSGLAEWEERVAKDVLPRGGRVIVTSAGAGREVLALRLLGYDAVGFEPNALLVEAGREVLASAGHPDVLHQSLPDVFPAISPADAVVVGWGSIMLIQGRGRRVAFLRSARDAVPEGAPLLVSFFARPPVRYFAVVSAVARPLRRLRRLDPVELGDALSPNFVHYFSPDEIQSELRAGGWAMTEYHPTPYAHAVAKAT